jgi:glycosyltransferase involved in cell wall biosynthesis
LIRFGTRTRIITIANGIPLQTRSEQDSFYKGEIQSAFLFIGRLVKYKNLNVLIDALPQVVKAVPSARLVIAGDGPMRSEWEGKVCSLGLKEKIKFLGYVSESAKQRLLSNCSALVLPSIIEGFGLVILEAFASGRPVLVSNIESCREIVEDGVDGFLLHPQRKDEWSRKMIQLLTDTSLSAALGSRGRAKAEQRFDLCKVTTDHEELYVELLARSTRDVILAKIKKEGVQKPRKRPSYQISADRLSDFLGRFLPLLLGHSEVMAIT